MAHAQQQEAVGAKGNHRVTLGLGHSFMSKGRNNEGKTVWLPVPSWSLNYDYWISNRWALGLQTDLVTETFEVEESDGQSLERERPVALVLAAIFKPGRHFSFIAGGGIEFEHERNLGLSRLGIEYGLELPKQWEAGVALIWDNKWNYYNSWAIEFTFAKLFRKKRTDEN